MPVFASSAPQAPSTYQLLGKGTVAITGDGTVQTVATFSTVAALEAGQFISIRVANIRTLGTGTPDLTLDALGLALGASEMWEIVLVPNPTSATETCGSIMNITNTNPIAEERNNIALDFSAAETVTITTNPAAGTDFTFVWSAYLQK